MPKSCKVFFTKSFRDINAPPSISMHEIKTCTHTFSGKVPRRRVLLAFATGRQSIPRHSARLHATPHSAARLHGTLGMRDGRCAMAQIGRSVSTSARVDGVVRHLPFAKCAVQPQAHIAALQASDTTHAPLSLVPSPHPKAPGTLCRHCTPPFCSVVPLRCYVLFRRLRSVPCSAMPSALSQRTPPCCIGRTEQPTQRPLTRDFCGAVPPALSRHQHPIMKRITHRYR